MVGKAKHNKGGVKWVSTPMSRGMTTSVYLSDAECSYPLKEGPLLPVEGGFISSIRNYKDENNEETEMTARALGHAPPRNRGEAG